MPARATGLNRHGAAVQLNRELQVGSTVVIQNSRRSQASARIVAQVSAEIGELLNGAAIDKAGWPLVFKSVGIAVEDIAAAKLVYELVERRTGKIGFS